MENHVHEKHSHVHGAGCGHVSLKHGDHVDFVHDGHLHHVEGAHIDEHRLDVNAMNPDICKRLQCLDPTAHAGHAEVVPHGNHTDFLVDGRLHHLHGDHCDDHGPVTLL